MQELTTDTAAFALQCRPTFALVSVIRRFVDDFVRGFATDADASRVALATHELLENAVKFSLDGTATLRLQIDTHVMQLKLENRAYTRHIDAVKSTLANVAEVPSASHGLGLARICAEAGMKLMCRVEGNNLVLEAMCSRS